MEKEVITLMVETLYGYTSMDFEILKSLGGNKYILYAPDKICVGEFYQNGSWFLSDPFTITGALKNSKCLRPSISKAV